MPISDEVMAFKYVGDNASGNGSIFEAGVRLPDDGTPGGEQMLRIRIETCEGENPSLSLDVVSSYKQLENAQRVRRILDGEVDIDKAANLLYGAARLEIIKVIRPR
jgi:hypothetical protein